MTKWKLPEGRAPMTDAPERIQAWVWDLPYPSRLNMRPEWNSDMYPADQNVKEYIRADLVDASAVLEAKLAKAVEALEKINVGEGWAAHIARTTLEELEQKQ